MTYKSEAFASGIWRYKPYENVEEKDCRIKGGKFDGIFSNLLKTLISETNFFSQKLNSFDWKENKFISLIN